MINLNNTDERAIKPTSLSGVKMLWLELLRWLALVVIQTEVVQRFLDEVENIFRNYLTLQSARDEVAFIRVKGSPIIFSISIFFLNP